jgi:flavin-dependent dehydrogenase
MRYDLGIIGGGVAGLSLSILAAEKGFRVVLFEKETYPFPRVCGEYISKESLPFLKRLGIQTETYPSIEFLQITSQSGFKLEMPLDLGAIGISRYTLDMLLYERAKQLGVVLCTNTLVENCIDHLDHTIIKSNSGNYEVEICVGAFGKRSQLDRVLSRSNILRKKNFVGVKYHLDTEAARDTIFLHNFKGGYAGFSAVENNRFCFCYMVDSQVLKKEGGKIDRLEDNVLSRNPYIHLLLKNADILPDYPITISQIEFGKKPKFMQRMLVIGDAAGTIAPLSGNGMSMAFRAASLLMPLLETYFINRDYRALDHAFDLQWNQAFATRIWLGNRLQQVLGNPQLTDGALKLLNQFKPLAQKLVSYTHGNPF